MKIIWDIFFCLVVGVPAILLGSLAAWCGDEWPRLSLSIVILGILIAGRWFLGNGVRALPLLLLVAMTGCASHKSTVIRKTSSDGTTEITRSATRTLFDSKSRLADNRVESRSASNSQTIAIGSLAQESSGSNVVALLEKAALLAAELEKLKTSLPDVSALNGARPEGPQGRAAAARLAHNQEVVGATPAPATNLVKPRGSGQGEGEESQTLKAPLTTPKSALPASEVEVPADAQRGRAPSTVNSQPSTPGETEATTRQNLRRALRQQL